MFCRNCGKEIAADALACPNCGAVGPGASPAVNAHTSMRAEKRGPSGCFVIILIFLSLSVLGMLAGIALPAYQDYVTRSKVGDAIDAVESLKKQIETSWAQSKTMPDHLRLDEMRQARGSAIIDDVELNSTSGGLTLKFNGGVPAVAYKSFRLVPTMNDARPLVWVCRNVDVPPKYLPVTCR